MYQLSAHKLHTHFTQGNLTAEAIAKYFLGRVKKFNPDMNAFLRTHDDDVLEKARAQDERRKAGKPLGKLAGVPVAIKDNMHIEGELTTCGSRFLTNYRAPFEATAVGLLREQDALFIGKTNLDEFAMGSSTEHSAFGPTRNPWNLNCTPGGSSGGSAAAVGARLCPLATGSDTGGSIRQPASLCGVVGYKPTYGRISRYGLVAFGSSFDQIGPFGTDVKDAALMMEILGSPCSRDATSLHDPAESIVEYLDKEALKGKIVGVPFSMLSDLKQESRATFDQSLETLKSLGCTVIDVDLSILKYGIAAYYILATAEASTNLARFDGVRYGVRSPQAETLNEIYDLSKEEGFGAEVKRRILLGTYVLSAGYQDAYYKQAQKIRTLMIRAYQKAFATCQLIAMPVCPGPAFELNSVLDPLQMYLEDFYTVTANLTGVPAISVPAGFSKSGLPLGFQLIGPQKEDRELFRAAYAFEQATTLSQTIPPAYDKEVS